jgi:hypothetical protein
VPATEPAVAVKTEAVEKIEPVQTEQTTTTGGAPAEKTEQTTTDQVPAEKIEQATTDVALPAQKNRTH